MAADDIRLRPLVLPDDIELALDWYAEPGLLHDSEGTDQPYDRATLERMYGYFRAHGELFVIEVREGNAGEPDEWRAIGDAALGPNTIPIAIGVAGYRSRRIGSIVLDQLIARARELDWPSLEVHGVFEYNERSLRMYRRAGFVDSGTFTDRTGTRRLRLRLDLK